MSDDLGFALAQAERQQRQLRIVAMKRPDRLEIDALRRVDDDELESGVLGRKPVQFLQISREHDLHMRVARSERQGDRLAQKPDLRETAIRNDPSTASRQSGVDPS